MVIYIYLYIYIYIYIYISGPNLDLLCIRQLDAASFCENYEKFYFDSKHLEKGLKMGW